MSKTQHNLIGQIGSVRTVKTEDQRQLVASPAVPSQGVHPEVKIWICSAKGARDKHQELILSLLWCLNELQGQQCTWMTQDMRGCILLMSPVLVGTSHHHISSSTATAPLLTPASTLNCLLEKASSQISVTLFFVTQKHVKTAAEIFLSQGGLLHLCWGKKEFC